MLPPRRGIANFAVSSRLAMPHLLVATPYFHPRIGGAENYSWQIARRLALRSGFRVSVVTSRSEPAGAARESLDGMEVHRLPIWLRWSNTPLNALWFAQLRRLIRADPPDLVHLHAPVPFMADVAARAAGRIPTVLTYHAGSMAKGRWPIDMLIGLYERIALPALFRRVTALVAVSPQIVREQMRGHAHKATVIPPGVDLEQFRPAPLAEDLRTVTFVGSVARSAAWKGIDVLLHSMADVMRAVPQARLEIVGGGDALEHHARCARDLGISDAVRFCGPQRGASLADAYRRASVVVLPSKSAAESFGMVLLEAMASGRPVIGSRIGGIPELIEDGSSGLLVPPGDPQALASAIVRVLRDRRLAQGLAEAGVRKAGLYDWEIQCDRYVRLFDSIVDAGAGSGRRYHPSSLAGPGGAVGAASAGSRVVGKS